jgi:precorrin-6A/cobalt-precorrin-6A reductase
MRPEHTVLVMAGSREAHGLITGLRARGRHVIASLPEPERMFGSLPVPTRVGGFENSDEMAVWMQAQSVATVIDASHAFDTEVSRMAGSVCTRLALRYIRVLRPPWTATILDRWHHVSSVAQAARLVPKDARVFANTGWQSVNDYADFSGERLFLRQTHEARSPSPYRFMEFIVNTPPFSQFQEQALFEELRITHLICRNVGGAASMSKLLAARVLSVPVYMVARSQAPAHLKVVDTVPEALAWETNP